MVYILSLYAVLKSAIAKTTAKRIQLIRSYFSEQTQTNIAANKTNW